MCTRPGLFKVQENFEKLPVALQMRQSSSVEQTKGQLHMWTSCIVDTPRKMKMRVSLTLLHIFRKYWMLVLLRSDTFASTYCFMVTAQVTMLQMCKKERHKYTLPG